MIVFSCPHCDEPLPEAAHYCPVCGETLISPKESDSIQSHTSPETDTTQTLPGKDVMTPGEDAIMPTPEQPQATAFKVPYFYDMGIDDGQSAQPVEPDESELTQPVGLSAGLSTALMPVRPAQEKSTPTPSRINATLLPTDAEASDSQQRGVSVASKPSTEVRSNWNKVVPPGSAHLAPLPVTPRPKTALKTPPTLPTLKPTQPKALWRVPPPPLWFWVTTIVLLGLLFGGLLGVILTLKAHQPGEITLEVTPSAVPLYGTITLHGSNFQPNTSVGLMRDREFIAIVDSNYKSIISTDRSGSFTDTVFVDAAWGTGSHTIYAEEALTHKVASSTITVTGHVDSSRPPHLTISQTSLNLGIGDQATNSPAIITLGDSGGGVIYWQSTTTQPWLVLSPQQGKVAGDQPMSVTVAGDRSKLSPGAYTGDIIITSTAGKALVAVTMQVIPLIAGHEAVLQVTPAALSFTATDGGANPPTQTITISNPGVQTLQWGTSTSTLNGGNWLTVSPQSGNIAPQGASESVKIGVNTSTLLPGVYRGEVTFSNAGTQQVQDSPQPVFVSLTVQPQCALSVIPGVLTITDAYLQPAPAPTVVNVGTNQGCSKPLNWTASTTTSNGGSWLNIGATSGTAPGSLSVSVNVAGLQPGTYNGQIMLTSTSGSLTLPVTFIMGQPTSPIMGTAPAALSLSGVAGQTTSNSQSINITNSGGGTLSWQATTSGGWLTVAQASGSIASRATASIAVSAALVGLTPGTYTGTITITATGATGSPQSIPVTLTVSPPCTISAAPVALTFAGLVGGPNQAQPATISASGTCNTDVLNWSASVVTSSGGAWLSASPLAGSVSLSATSGTSVGVSLAGLGAGTYTGTVTITAIDSATGKAVGTPQVILITLDMTAPPVLTVSPTSLTFNVTTGTSPQPITIGNSGGEPLNWKAVLTPGGPSFVSLSARSGSNLAGGTTTSTNVIVNATGVTGGQTYFASVTISAIDPSTGKPTQGSGTIVSITINVAAPAMQVTPISLSFNAIQGSNPASQTITITDTGGDGLGWTVGRPSASWLTASPRGGSDKSGASSQVTFSVNTNGLNPGSYSASVTITPSIGSPVTINVALTVNGVTPTPLPTPNVTPGPSPTDTPTPQPSPSPTATPTPQPSPSPTATPTPQPSPSPTATPSPTPSPTDTPTPTPTPTPTDTPTPTPTATASPTDTPTPTVTDTPSPTPAPTPTTTGTATTTATPDVTATTTPDVTPSASPTSTATSNTTGQTTSITLISTGVVPHSGPHVAARVLRSFHPVTSHILPTRATPRPGPHVNTPISWPSRNAAFRDPQ